MHGLGRRQPGNSRCGSPTRPPPDSQLQRPPRTGHGWAGRRRIRRRGAPHTPLPRVRGERKRPRSRRTKQPRREDRPLLHLLGPTRRPRRRRRGSPPCRSGSSWRWQRVRHSGVGAVSSHRLVGPSGHPREVRENRVEAPSPRPTDDRDADFAESAGEHLSLEEPQPARDGVDDICRRGERLIRARVDRGYRCPAATEDGEPNGRFFVEERGQSDDQGAIYRLVGEPSDRSWGSDAARR